jgi:anti-repressor protein
MAQILGYAATTRDSLINTLRFHVEDTDLLKKQVVTGTRATRAWFVNESGMYSLIFGSKKPEAKRFKHWVTSEVLPRIRKGEGTPEQKAVQD